MSGPPHTNRRPLDGRWAVVGALAAVVAATVAVLSLLTGDDIPEQVAAVTTVQGRGTTSTSVPTSEAVPTSDAVGTTASSAQTTTTLPPTSLPPGPVYLTDLGEVDSSICLSAYPRTLSINGEEYSRSIGDDMFCGDGRNHDISFDLGRDFTSFAAVFGQDDRSSGETGVRFDIYDETDRLLWTGEFQLGESEEVSLDVTNVLRLVIVANSFGSGSNNDVRYAIGEPRVSR